MLGTLYVRLLYLVLNNYSSFCLGGLQVLSDDKYEDSDVKPAPKLIESVLQNCRGRVDEWVEPYLSICLDRLRRTEDKYLKDLLIEVVGNGRPATCDTAAFALPPDFLHWTGRFARS